MSDSIGTTDEVMAAFETELTQGSNNDKYQDSVDNPAEVVATPEPTPEPEPAPEEKEPPSLQERLQELDERVQGMRKSNEASSFQQKQELENMKMQHQMELQKHIPLEKLLADPQAALATHGVRFDDIANRVIQAGGATPQQAPDPVMKQYIEKLEGKLSKLEESVVESQNNAQLARINSEVDQHIKDPKYQIVAEYVDPQSGAGIQQSVQHVMGLEWQNTGKMLTVPEALDRLKDVRLTELQGLLKNESVVKELGLSIQPAQPTKDLPDNPTKQRVPPVVVNNPEVPKPVWTPSQEAKDTEEQLKEIANMLNQAPEADTWGD